jgi:hypothetical protein
MLVKHNIFIIEIVVVYYDLYDIHEKFEYSCDVTNKAHLTPSWLVYFVLKAQPFFINFD